MLAAVVGNAGKLISWGETSWWAVVAAAWRTWGSWLSRRPGLAISTGWTALTRLSRLAWSTVVAVLATGAWLSGWAGSSGTSGTAGWAWWWLGARGQSAGFTSGALGAWTAGRTGWSNWSSGSGWTVVSIASVAAWVAGAAIWTGWSGRTGRTAGCLARALWGNRQQTFVEVCVATRGSWSAGSFSGSAIFAGCAWGAVGAGWALLASAALSLNLTSGTEEHVQSVLWAGLGHHVDHLLPHVTRARLAVFDLALDGGLQLLHVVEHHGESDEASGDCDRAEDHGAEGDGAE